MKEQRDSRIIAKLCWFSFPFLFGVNIANEILTFSLLNFAQKLFNFNISHSAFAFKLLMQAQKQVALQAQICRIQMLGGYRNRHPWSLNSKSLHGNRLPSAFFFCRQVATLLSIIYTIRAKSLINQLAYCVSIGKLNRFLWFILSQRSEAVYKCKYRESIVEKENGKY